MRQRHWTVSAHLRIYLVNNAIGASNAKLLMFIHVKLLLCLHDSATDRYSRVKEHFRIELSVQYSVADSNVQS